MLQAPRTQVMKAHSMSSCRCFFRFSGTLHGVPQRPSGSSRRHFFWMTSLFFNIYPSNIIFFWGLTFQNLQTPLALARNTCQQAAGRMGMLAKMTRHNAKSERLRLESGKRGKLIQWGEKGRKWFFFDLQLRSKWFSQGIPRKCP